MRVSGRLYGSSFICLGDGKPDFAVDGEKMAVVIGIAQRYMKKTRTQVQSIYNRNPAI